MFEFDKARGIIEESELESQIIISNTFKKGITLKDSENGISNFGCWF